MTLHGVTPSVPRPGEAQGYVESTVTEGTLTGEGDVEASLPCGVVGLEL